MTTNAITYKSILTCVIKHQREFDEEVYEINLDKLPDYFDETGHIEDNSSFEAEENSLCILARLFSTDTEYARLRKKAGKAWGRFLCFRSIRTVPMLPPMLPCFHQIIYLS